MMTVAGPQGGDEDFFDIEQKTLAIDRAVDQPWRLDTVMAQGGEEGRCLPVPVRHFGLETLAARRPSVQRRHVRLGPGLVDEDEPGGVDPTLMPYPLLTAAGNVAAILFAGDQRLFL
jgi:hypothetical protein